MNPANKLPASITTVLSEFRNGKSAALARAVSIVENQRAGFDQLLAELHPSIGRARRIGITGPPGAGKSTLTTALVKQYRAKDLRVAIVAVDPTSPFTGGALLGDRIRMESVALDPGVFIRSMATRGSLGGLAASTRDVCDVLDAFGVDVILIETVGVGQSELEVARTADTTLVMLVPESGDSIQTLKAGVMEIADVFVVNKADRPGADRLRKDVELMLHMRASTSRAEADQTQWTPPVLTAIAQDGQGVDAIVSALDQHVAHLQVSGELRARRHNRLRERVLNIVEQQLSQRLRHDRQTGAWLDEQLAALESGAVAPLVVATNLRERSAELFSRDPKPLGN